ASARRAATPASPVATACIRRIAIESRSVAPAAERASAWEAAEVPAMKVTMYGAMLTSAGVGAGVGSGVPVGSGVGSGAVVGSGVASGVGADVGSGVAVGSGAALGSGATLGSGAADGSADGAGLSLGGWEGSAAIVPMGATSANSRRTTCRPMRTRWTRETRRAADGDPNIDMTPLPGAPTPRRPGARSVDGDMPSDEDHRPYDRA